MSRVMPDAPPPLRQFQAIVFADPALLQELRRAPDRASFVDLVVKRSRERGCALDPAVIEATLDAAAHAWLLRWIER